MACFRLVDVSPGAFLLPEATSVQLRIQDNDCGRGTFNPASTGHRATYDPETGSIDDCVPCPQNTYGAEPGALGVADVCLSCPWGTTAKEEGSVSIDKCSSCEFIYIGSERCDVPVLAVCLVVALALLLATCGTIVWKRHKHLNEVKQALAFEWLTTWDTVILDQLVGQFGPWEDLWKGTFKGATVVVQRTFGLPDYKFLYEEVL